MNLLAIKLPNVSKYFTTGIFGFGLLLLIGSWFILYQVEALFAESHLASYYCCLMPHELEKIGAFEQTISNFFRTSPGRDLFGLVFILANIGVFVSQLRKATGRSWLLPLLFVAFNILYFTIDLELTGLSWSISDWIVGPRSTPYKGYHRTWYGIVLHFSLWVAFFYMVLKASRVLITSVR